MIVLVLPVSPTLLGLTLLRHMSVHFCTYHEPQRFGVFCLVVFFFFFCGFVVVVLFVFGRNRKITALSSREHGKIHTPFMKGHWEKPSQWGQPKSH